MRHTGVVHGQQKHGHMPSVVTRCSSPRDRLAGWRCPRPGRQGGLPAKVGITTPGRRPAMLQARPAHWRLVAARDQPGSLREARGGRLPARRSRLAGSPWASSACQISCGRCWAAPRTSDREDVSGRFDAGEQHAAVGTERRSCELAVVEFVGRKRVGLALVRRTDKVLDALGVLGASDGYGRLFRIRSGCSGCPRVSYRVVFHRGVTSTADGVPTPSDPDANGLVRSTG